VQCAHIHEQPAHTRKTRLACRVDGAAVNTNTHCDPQLHGQASHVRHRVAGRQEGDEAHRGQRAPPSSLAPSWAPSRGGVFHRGTNFCRNNFHSCKLFYLPTDRKNMFFSAFHKQLWFQRGSSLSHRAERLVMLTARREYWPHKSFEKLHLLRAARLVATGTGTRQWVV
jgi:hypothetical protein